MDPLYQFLHVLKYFFLVPMTCCRAHILGLGGAMSEEEGIWDAGKVGTGESKREGGRQWGGVGGGGESEQREGYWVQLQPQECNGAYLFKYFWLNFLFTKIWGHFMFFRMQKCTLP